MLRFGEQIVFILRQEEGQNGFGDFSWLLNVSAPPMLLLGQLVRLTVLVRSDRPTGDSSRT